MCVTNRLTSPDGSSTVDRDESRNARLQELKALIDSGSYDVSSCAIADGIVDRWSWDPPVVALDSEAGVVELVEFGPAPEPVYKQSRSPVEQRITTRSQSRRSLNSLRKRFDVGEWVNSRRLQEQLSRMVRYAHL